MGSLLLDLGCNVILPADIAVSLRNYISIRNPNLPSDTRAGIFADAVNRIVDGRLPAFGTTTSARLKSVLYRDIAWKPVFSIDCADVFKAAVKLKTVGHDFFAGLNNWLIDVLNKAVTRESLFNLVIYAHKLMDSIPGTDTNELIDSVEDHIGGIRFINLTSEYAGTQAVASIGSLVPELNNASIDNVIEYERLVNLPVAVDSPIGRKANLIDAIRNYLKVFEPKIVFAATAAAATISFMLIAGNVKNEAFTQNKPTMSFLPAAVSAGQVFYEGAKTSESLLQTNYNTVRMKATAYDLSVGSCGKTPDDPMYGVTNSGTKATVGRTVAVDPKVIPLGTRLYITFPEEYSYLDGEYVAEDTGRLIQGNDIDIFFGEDKPGSSSVHDSAMEFGVRYVDVRIID